MSTLKANISWFTLINFKLLIIDLLYNRSIFSPLLDERGERKKTQFRFCVLKPTKNSLFSVILEIVKLLFRSRKFE